jgi:hypothetical protein
MDYNVPAQPVNANEYCELATSRRNLRRADDDENGKRGLIDLDLGVRYVVDESLLSHYQRSPSSTNSRQLVVPA